MRQLLRPRRLSHLGLRRSRASHQEDELLSRAVGRIANVTHHTSVHVQVFLDFVPLAKRSFESDVGTCPSAADLYVQRNVTKGLLTSISCTQHSTEPTPLIPVTR